MKAPRPDVLRARMLAGADEDSLHLVDIVIGHEHQFDPYLKSKQQCGTRDGVFPSAKKALLRGPDRNAGIAGRALR